jgi:hypothetical protein
MKLKEPIYIINAKTNSCTAFTQVTKIEGSLFELPYKIEYKKEVCHNLETCDSCKNVHQQIFTQLSKVFQNFPLCCDYHANLVKANWFNKKEFNGFPKWTADKVMSAYHHFICKIDVADWQKDIPDYIEYILDSLGSMPEGFGEPLGYSKVIIYLIDLIKGCHQKIELKDFEIKRAFILKYLQSKLVVVKAEKFDVQSLINIYSKWYKNFPFELELFSELKEKYAKEIPLLTGEIYYNPYLKVVKAKMVTQEQLIDFLFNLTTSILLSIETDQMLEEEYISNQSKYNLDIKKKAHSLAQNSLLTEYSKGEKRYIKTIKKWLENENKFISDILPQLPKQLINKRTANIPNSFFLLSAENSDEPIKDFFDTLSKNKYIEDSSKSNFVKAFSGKLVKQKIVWSGAFGDLKSLIEYLIELKKIKPTGHNQWQITANIFTRLNGGDFSSKDINATKKTKNDENINNIVANL